MQKEKGNIVIHKAWFIIKYVVILFLFVFCMYMLMTSKAMPFPFYGKHSMIRILCASIAVMIMPGYLVFNIAQLRRRYEMDFFEIMAVSFGISLVVIEVFCILALEAHLNSFIISLSLCFILGALSVVNFLKERKTGMPCEKHENSKWFSALLTALVIFSMLSTAVLLYKIESPISSGEDLIHISVVRKLLENSILTKENVWIKQNFPYTYLYPGLHFMIALISRFAQLDPIVVYAKFRFILGMLSIVIIWAFSKALFKSRYIAFTITFSSLALIYNGMAGQLPGFFCGQLIPVSHVSDISMGILLPLALIFSFKYILSEGIFNRFLILSCPVFLITTIIHGREGIQILFYYAVTLIAYLVFNRKDTKTIYKIIILLCAMLLLGTTYKMVHSQSVEHIQQLEDIRKKKATEVFNDLLKDPRIAFSTPDKYSDVKAFVPGGKLIFKKYIVLAVPLSIVILVLFRHTFWGLFFGSSIIASLLFMRFNIFAIFMVLHTYSEIMYTPGRFILYFSYAIFGLIVYDLLLAIDRIFFYVKKAGAANSIFLICMVFCGTYLFSRTVFVPLNSVAQRAIYVHGTLLLILIACAASIMFFKKTFIADISNFKKQTVLKYPFLGLCSLFFILYPVYRYGGQENPAVFVNYGYDSYGATNIFDAYRIRTQFPDITDFEAYCAKVDIFNLPFGVIKFIRENIPSGNIFAYNKESEKRNFFSPEAIFVSSFANQYVAVAPSQYRLFIVDDEYLQASRGVQQIVFNYTETDAEKLKLIQRFKFTYILLDPPFSGLSAIFNKYACFKKVYDEENYLIYSIDRKGLKKIIKEVF